MKAGKEEDQMEPMDEDFKSYYAVIRNQIEDNENFDVFATLQHLEDMLMIIKQEEGKDEEGMQLGLSKDHRIYFLNEGLPNIVRALLLRRYPEAFKGNPSHVLRVNQFLQAVLDFIIPFIAVDGPFGLLDILRRIFDEHRYLYLQTMNLEQTWQTKEEEVEEGQQYAVTPIKDKYMSLMPYNHSPPLLVSSVNFFGQKGGFDQILARLRSKDPVVSIPVLKLYILVLWQLRDVFTPEAKEQFFPELQQVVADLLLRLSDDQLRPLEKTDFEQIVKHLQAALETVPSQGIKVHEVMEKFCLDFALKCFKCSLLEKKMNGLVYIEDVLEQAHNRDRSYHHMDEFTSPSMMNPFSKASKWIDVAYMVNWLVDNKILEELFSIDPHVVLIKRSSKILQFMAYKNGLKQEYIDLIWSATIGKHESITNATQEVISESCGALTESQLSQLINKINEIQFNEFNTRTVSLIMDLARTTYPSIKNQAMDMLWKLILDDNSNIVRPEVQAMAMQKLLSLVEQYPLRPKRFDLLGQYIRVLETGTSVLQALRLIRQVIDTFSEKHEFDRKLALSEESKGQVTLTLEEKFKLSSLILREVVQYKTRAGQQARKFPNGTDKELNSMRLERCVYAHLEQVTGRLDFLYFIISKHPDILVAREQIDIVWDQFIVDSLTTEEKEAAYDWFTRLLSSTEHESPTLNELTEYIFKDRLCTLDFSKLSITGFRCFMHYFIYINRNGGKLTAQEEVIQFDLVGFDQLWTIALQAQSTRVFTQTVDFLIKLHQKLAKNFQGEKSKSADNFISACMSNLKTALPPNPIDTNRIDRCITMLKEFLDHSKPPLGVPQHDRGHLLSIVAQINISDITMEPFKVPIFSNDPISVLRHKISQHIDVPPECLIMMRGLSTEAGGIELSDDKTLQEVHFVSSEQGHITVTKYLAPVEAEKPKPPSEDEMQKAHNVMEIFGLTEAAALVALKKSKFILDETVTRLATEDQFLATVVEEASKLSPPSEKMDEHQERTSPSLLLVNNQEYFDQLFVLLNIETIDKQKVWDILMKLPTNQKILDHIRNLKEKKDSIDWTITLDSRPQSVYRLLYSLQIIVSLMQPVEGSGEDKEEERLKWCKDFLYSGGFHHIFKIFTGTDIHDKYATHKAWKTCLPLLLKIINFFIKGDTSLASSIADQKKQALRHSGETLKKSVDFPSFITMMIKLVASIAVNQDEEAMQPAMSLLVVSVLSKEDLLETFYNMPGIDDFILSILLKPMSVAIRKEAGKGFYQLCCASRTDERLVHPHTHFLELLLHNIPSDLSSTCEQFFELLNQLIKDSCTGKLGGSPAKFKDLLDTVVIAIKTRPFVEQHRSDNEDRVLMGLMSIVYTLVSQDANFKQQIGSANGHAMVEEIFTKCLFSLPSEKDYSALANAQYSAKCKTHASRGMALNLLAELGRNCRENFTQLIRMLKPHHLHSNSEEATSWDNPKIFEKSNTGYVGLKNLGSICYVNSLMQQFYMMPELRNTLIQLSSSKEEKPGEDLMSEIQLMFSYLFCSERQYFNPGGFCKAFRDWEGNPINTALQADVLEFFNILCDHLENNLKGTPESNLLGNSFAGTLSQEFICKDCPHYSETLEPFYTISVDIKGKKDLLEALDSFVEGEMLEGNSAYSCEQCKKKVRALKRCSIKKLSPTLIIHLKRFEYVLDRQTPHKLSDKFEFPLELDIEPYTKEGIVKREGKGVMEDAQADEESKYELVGVLVHSGHADAGHYYSFIKERDGNAKGQWLRFDDIQVSAFDVNNLAEECFGGTQKTTYSSYSGHVSTREQPRMKNAYMLFYERRVSVRQRAITTDALLKEPLLKRIRQENYQLLRDRQLFDTEYFNFMLDLISNVDFPKVSYYDEDPLREDIAFETIQVATFFVFETLMRVRDQHKFLLWMKPVKRLFENHTLACKWFLALLLTERRNWFRYLLLECYDEFVRDHFTDLIFIALKSLGPLEYSFYLEMEGGASLANAVAEADASSKEVLSMVPRAMCLKFMENFLSMLELTRQHWRRFSQYFKLLRDYALLGPWERVYLAHKHIVALLVDYYMGPFSPNLRPGVQRVRIGDNNSPADLNYFMQAMAILIRSQATDGAVKQSKVPMTAYDGNIEYPPLHEKDKRLLYNRDFFASLIKQGYNVEANRDIVGHCTWEDEERTQWMLEILMDLICKANWNACENLFAAVEAMLEVHDSIEKWRFQIALNLEENGLIDVINYYKDRYPKFTQTCIKFTVKIINEFPLAAGFLYYTRKDWWSWLEPWMRSRITQHANDAEVTALNRDLRDFVDGKLVTKHEKDYVTLWKPDPDHQKSYKLFIQKF